MDASPRPSDADANAPIAFFAFRRPTHTRQTLEALAANPGADTTPLVAFCDGPRNEADIAPVEDVKDVISNCRGFASVKMIERPKNLGLANSIISGVSEVLREFERLIVVEDDLITAPSFLTYMNEGLRMYADSPRVASIHAYVYPTANRLPETFFLRGADCWGWGTWRRAWSIFESDASLLAAKMHERGLEHIFDMDGAYPFTQMLHDCVDRKVDSWAIRWHASAFLDDMLTLYPSQSLVRNIGTDGSGTHGDNSEAYDGTLASSPPAVRPIDLMEDVRARQEIVNFFRDAAMSEEQGDGTARLVAEPAAKKGFVERLKSLFG